MSIDKVPFNPDGWNEDTFRRRSDENISPSKYKKYSNPVLHERIHKLIEATVAVVSKKKEYLLVEVLEEHLGRVPSIKDVQTRCKKELSTDPAKRDEEIIYLDDVPILWIKTELTKKHGNMELKLTYRK